MPFMVTENPHFTDGETEANPYLYTRAWNPTLSHLLENVSLLYLQPLSTAPIPLNFKGNSPVKKKNPKNKNEVTFAIPVPHPPHTPTPGGTTFYCFPQCFLCKYKQRQKYFHISHFPHDFHKGWHAKYTLPPIAFFFPLNGIS